MMFVIMNTLGRCQRLY